MVIYQWRVEAGTNRVAKKVNFYIDPNEWQILSVKICLCLTFDVGAVDGSIVGCSIFVSGWNFADSILLLTFIYSNLSSRYRRSLDWCSSCGGVAILEASVDGVSEARVTNSFPLIFDETSFVLSLSSGVSYQRRTSSYIILFNYSCCFSINWFSSVCSVLNISSDQANIYWSVISIYLISEVIVIS